MPILTVKLDKETHKMLRMISAKRGETMQQIAERLLREFVGREMQKFADWLVKRKKEERGR